MHHRNSVLTALAAALAMIMIAAAPSPAGARTAATPTVVPAPQLAPQNPDFVLWRASAGLRQALESSGLRGFGERPAPHLVLSGSEVSPQDLTFSSSFDLRDQNRLTPVKNQGALGTCWSFATYGSLESMLMPAQQADFSEDNLVLTSGFDTGSTPAEKYDHGGNLWYSTAYLARWSGPVLESQDAYGDSVTPAGLSAALHVQDISWYPARSSATDNDAIKDALTTCGAVYASMSWQGATNSTSAYYNASTHAYHYNGTDPTNHAVVIVGWDDGYSATNFSTTPPGNGAFIVRNSWGTNWGGSGYFHISYYDTKFVRGSYAATFEGAESAGNYGSVYQYDDLGDVDSIGYGAGTPIWGANKFTATSDGTLQAVGFYAEAPDTAYEVWEGPTTTSLTKLASGTLPRMGFHTVDLPTAPALTAGSSFVVAVKVTSASYAWPLAIECPLVGYSSQATGVAGQSYFSSNGSSWTDLTGYAPQGNVCLKAYTAAAMTQAPTSSSSYAFAADATSAWKTSGQQVTVTASGGTGTRTIHYSLNGGATWTSQAGDSVPFTVSDQGSHHIKYYASTASGTESPHDAGYVNIDSEAPTTTDDHPASATLGPLTVTLTPQDATSGMSGGLARTEYKVDSAVTYAIGTGVSLAEGTHTVAYRSTDKAGNRESPDKTFTVTVLGPPTPVTACAYSFSSSRAGGWKNTAQQFTVSVSGGSGTGRQIHYSVNGGATWNASSAASVDVPVTDGAHHVLYYADDSLDLEPTHDAGWINVDTGTPSTKAARASVRRGARVALRYRVTDPPGGCGKAVLKLQIRKKSKVVKTIALGTKATNRALKYRFRAKLKAGTYTWRVLAKDLAGNVALRRTAGRLVVK